MLRTAASLAIALAACAESESAPARPPAPADAGTAARDAGGPRDAGTISHHARACDPAITGPDLALDAPTPVDNRRIYKIAGTPVSLCVVRTAYPYSSSRGHRLWAVVDLFAGNDAATYDLSTNTYARFHGVRIDVGIAKRDFSSPGVWVRAALAP